MPWLPSIGFATQECHYSKGRNVNVPNYSEDGVLDQYDNPAANKYLVYRDERSTLCARGLALLSHHTFALYAEQQLFPHLPVTDRAVPKSPRVWEGSRFENIDQTLAPRTRKRIAGELLLSVIWRQACATGLTVSVGLMYPGILAQPFTGMPAGPSNIWVKQPCSSDDGEQARGLRVAAGFHEAVLARVRRNHFGIHANRS